VGTVARSWTVVLLVAAAAGAASCGVFGGATSPPAAAVFTPAHRTTGDAVRAFFDVRPRVQQPIPFPHKVHIAKKAQCTDCHESVERGPVAGLPGVKTCMTCHSQIATDRPLIRQITAWSDQGLDIEWKRVYGYTHEAHVRFNHAPHIRANVGCATCHGDLGQQTVAERVVDLNMGFCVNCHKAKNASNDCLTCHF
jgi:formylmethanofuran dehydrogenase subunit E